MDSESQNLGNLAQNAIGTAYNVLSEQSHPDAHLLEPIMREMLHDSRGTEGQFDLRYRRFTGEALENQS